MPEGVPEEGGTRRHWAAIWDVSIRGAYIIAGRYSVDDCLNMLQRCTAESVKHLSCCS